MSVQSLGARVLLQSRGHTVGRATAFGVTGGIWALALGSLAFRLYRDATRPPVFDDLLPVWTGVHNFLNHLPVYALHSDLQNYLYPPSSLVLLSPLGLIDYAHLKLPFLLLEAMAMYVAAALSLRIVGVRWTASSLGLLLLGLTIFEPARALFDVKNVDSVVVLGEVLALLAMSRNRWLLGAVLLALTIAVKPAIFPILLIPLLFRRWSAAGVSVLILVALNFIGFALLADGPRFLTTTVPHLIAGNGAFLRSWNVSLVGAFTVLGLPVAMAAPFRLVVVAVSAGLVWRTLVGRSDLGLKLAQISGFVLLATILAFTFSFEHYLIYLLPFLAATLRRDWALDRRLALAGLVLIAVPDLPGQLLHSATLFWMGRLLYTAGCLLLLAAYWRRLLPRAMRAAVPATPQLGSHTAISRPRSP